MSFDAREALQRLRRHLATPIAEARNGALVKIAGILRFGPTVLEAPLSGRRCAAWTAFVTDVSGDRARRLIAESRRAPFLVEDPSGRALVAGPYARVIVDDHHPYQGFCKDPTPRMVRYLAAHGHSPGGPWNRPLQYAEGVLEEGERVAVLGIARRGALGYRDIEQVSIVAPKAREILVSDDPSVLD